MAGELSINQSEALDDSPLAALTTGLRAGRLTWSLLAVPDSSAETVSDGFESCILRLAE